MIIMRLKLDKNFLVQWRHEGRARLQKRWGKGRWEEGWTQVINFHVLFPIAFHIITINWKFLGRGLDLVTGQLVVMGEREEATGETNLLLIKKNINIISII